MVRIVILRFAYLQRMRGEASADAKRQLREQAGEQQRQRIEEEIRRAKVLARGHAADPTATPGGPKEGLSRALARSSEKVEQVYSHKNIRSHDYGGER